MTNTTTTDSCQEVTSAMNRKIAIVGLGYVGLPLAVAFGKKGSLVGFDVKQARIDELKEGTDSTK